MWRWKSGVGDGEYSEAQTVVVVMVMDKIFPIRDDKCEVFLLFS